MKELTNSLKAVLYSRVSSPIYSTFILAWCVYNWKAVFTLLFSEDYIPDRIATVESMLSPNDSFDWWTLIVPILTSIIFLAGKPAAESALFVLSARLKAWAEDKRDGYNEKRLLTPEQSKAFVDELHSYREKYKTLLLNRNEEIDVLRDRVEELNLQISNSEKELLEKDRLITEKNNDVSESNKRIKELESRFNIYYSFVRFCKVVFCSDYYIDSDERKQFEKLLGQSYRYAEIDAPYLNVIIYGFSRSYSYDYSNYYFDVAIRPNIEFMKHEDLTFLIEVMQMNNQISGRSRNAEDLALVEAAL